MNYNTEVDNVYMVEFKSGKIIHVGFCEVGEVKQYCSNQYSAEIIKTIYKEVYCNDGEE